jgi:hypothetical protein
VDVWEWIRQAQEGAQLRYREKIAAMARIAVYRKVARRLRKDLTTNAALLARQCDLAREALTRITELEKERDQYKVEFDATTDAVTVHIIQQRDAALPRIKVLERELDAAQTLAADYCANTEDALSQRDDAREEADRQCNEKVAALRTAGDNAEAGKKLMTALDAALARVSVLEAAASMARVVSGVCVGRAR